MPVFFVLVGSNVHINLEETSISVPNEASNRQVFTSSSYLNSSYLNSFLVSCSVNINHSSKFHTIIMQLWDCHQVTYGFL